MTLAQLSLVPDAPTMAPIRGVDAEGGRTVNTAKHVTAKTTKPTHIEAGQIRAFAISERIPPAEAQLWEVGSNGTDYGTHVWSERSAVEVMARYNERGNRLLLDIEHNGATLDDGEPAATAGYASLAIRDGAPWLIFDWSAAGAEQIATGQRRYLSGEYDVDPDTHEITKLYRVSLVADPGTYRARVLARAASPLSVTQEGIQMDPTIAAIMALLDSVTDPAAAVDAVRGFVSNLPGTDAPVDDVTEPMAADAPKPADKPAFASADDDKKPVAAAAPGAADSVVASAETAHVKLARDYALQSENALRDAILMRDGDRLAPSVRTWASSQKLEVVRGLIAAAPAEKVSSPSRVTATRGEGHGTGPASNRGLQGAELEIIQRAAGMFQASTSNRPHRDTNGNYVYPTVTPSEVRRMKAAAAAKDGK